VACQPRPPRAGIAIRAILPSSRLVHEADVLGAAPIMVRLWWARRPRYRRQRDTAFGTQVSQRRASARAPADPPNFLGNMESRVLFPCRSMSQGWPSVRLVEQGRIWRARTVVQPHPRAARTGRESFAAQGFSSTLPRGRSRRGRFGRPGHDTRRSRRGHAQKGRGTGHMSVAAARGRRY